MTSSIQEYLRIIYIFIKKSGKARVTDIAKYLDYTKSSVNRALKVLSSDGYIIYEAYSDIVLTPLGEREAAKIVKRHEILKAFLIQVLNVDKDLADEEANKMKYAVSENTINKFEKYIASIIDTSDLECKFDLNSEKCKKCIKLKAQNKFKNM